MSRRHHRDPKSLQEFIDATADHLREMWTGIEPPLPVLRGVQVVPHYYLERSGKLAGKPSRQSVNDSERRPVSGITFRITIKVGTD